VALTLRAPPPPVSPSQTLDSVTATPGRDSSGESEDSNASHGTEGHEGDEEEAARNRTLLLEAVHQFSKQWRVTPHVFFMLGKSVLTNERELEQKYLLVRFLVLSKRKVKYVLKGNVLSP
jgi:hypothetical protein